MQQKYHSPMVGLITFILLVFNNIMPNAYSVLVLKHHYYSLYWKINLSRFGTFRAPLITMLTHIDSAVVLPPWVCKEDLHGVHIFIHSLDFLL